MPFHVRTISDLRSLADRGLFARRHDRLVFELAELSDEETRAWGAKLSGLYSACGCEQGSVFVLVGLAAYALVLVVSPALRATGLWAEIGIGAAVAFGAAIVGKLIGLAHARRRLRATVDMLSDELMRRTDVGLT